VAGGVLHGPRPVPAGAGLAAPADAGGRPERQGNLNREKRDTHSGRKEDIPVYAKNSE
jgi:hypothetical protein